MKVLMIITSHGHWATLNERQDTENETRRFCLGDQFDADRKRIRQAE
jgi:hypothetical protein